ncbi:P-type conjugative transfer ATPase TrbB [Bartonella alsatica]|uniref:P-type conjugative transfer ATPase TrbB n=2 Tax=Bartonella alsatica TaxID=52764 RepID=J1IY97_9HYPH|nr:P-type conjugative transfer ATPase TrbB [Bartonella alsatica]EJF76255.1 P-type conjugative transfer ATPase TrbB [Bartonella alsatica IBS 382]QLC51800.1 P-type conjugative transfer ATPase TrbB [Bartonella alsatica]
MAVTVFENGQSLEQDRRLIQKMRFEFGQQVCDYLDDPTVIEIMLNPDGTLWVEHLGKSKKAVGTMDAHQAEAAMGTVATALGTQITKESPILECELPMNGSRFEAVIPPIVSAPTFTIRKKATRIFTLDDYVTKNIITPHQKLLLSAAVKDHKNILVVGGTGTGKTTLTNAILKEMTDTFPEERFVIIEDTAELQCAAPNTVTFRAVEYIDMTRLLKVTMRMAPDRIIVGEVRDGAALALLKSWNTGHPGGIATVHANDASAGLTRIQQLISEATIAPMQSLIAETIDVVLSIEKNPSGRKVKEIIEVCGYDPAVGKYITNLIH